MTSLFDQLNRELFPYTIGVGKILDAHRLVSEAAKKHGAFPFYNIKKTADNKFTIELAVAGYSLGDIELTLEKNVLTIASTGHDVDSNDYIHQGFSYKKFNRRFTLMDNIKVDGAELANGILSVWLSEFTKEEDKPKKINIQAPTAQLAPQLLNESSVF